MDVFALWHVYEKDGDNDEQKLIGVFSDEETATQAIELLKDQPGFVDYPDGFQVHSIKIDRIGWQEGFRTVLLGQMPDGDDAM